MDTRKRIFWITTQFPKSAESRSGMFIYRTVRELSKHYPITVLCLYPKILPVISIFKNPGNFSGIIRQWEKNNPVNAIKPNDNDNFEVIYIKYTRPLRGKLSFLEGYFAYIAVKKRLRNLLASGNNLLHANWIFPEGKTAELLSNEFNIPYIITLRGSDVNYLKRKSLNFKAAISVLENSKKITSVSESLLKKCEDLSLSVNDKKAITHNFYQTDKFIIKDKEKSRKFLGVKSGSKMIFYAGGLTKNKNVNILIESIYKLTSEGFNPQLYIAGTGYEESNLKNLVKEKKISDRVSFTGSLEPEELIEHYNAADLFCLASTNEGLPNVIVESLLCGTPVVATSVGEIPNLIKEGCNGFLTEPDSIASLSEKIKKCLSTTWERNKLRESMNFLFTENVLLEYRKLYGEFGFSD